ncbi:MAG: PHP domain-containing protein [Caldilineaceae bacterium]|nr:PHP domain-containing protein [Caldilineaceae bacterium]HRJ42124.1 PHP domain-containing protein [Caldilineaceae bacterium]
MSSTFPIFPVDLQAHSTFSDGTETPTELVEQAARLGIGVLAVTDHDSVLGVDEALAAGQRLGVRVLPAIEFSIASERKRDFLDINILGYGIRHKDLELQAILQRVMESRVEQKIRQVERLQSYGVIAPLDEVLALAGGVPGRPHIAQVALKHNPERFQSIDDVFRQFLAGDALNSVYVGRTFSLNLEDAIDLTHQAGGVAVLAHPGLYHRVQDMENALSRMVDAGLDGLEVRYPYAREKRRSVPIPAADELTAYFAAMAQQHNLLITAGSDYHGANKANRLGEAGLRWDEWQALCARCGW